MDGKGKQTGFSVLSEDPERSEECQWLSVCQDTLTLPHGPLTHMRRDGASEWCGEWSPNP